MCFSIESRIMNLRRVEEQDEFILFQFIFEFEENENNIDILVDQQ